MQLARKLGVSRDTVHRLESDGVRRLSLERAEKLAQVFEVNVKRLFDPRPIAARSGKR